MKISQNYFSKVNFGIALVLLLASGCGGGSGGGTGGTSPDTTAPVITLTGDNPQQIEVGSDYVELGATASDNTDGNISANIVIDASAANTATLTSFDVTYNVSDAAGNAATTKTRTVNVVDTTPPVITLLGDNPQTMEAGTDYVELGATAQDNLDGDVTDGIIIDTNNLNTAIPGTYGVIYISNDSEGNSQAVGRDVIVVDTTVPTISLTGDNPQTIEVNTNYTELGATATDNIDGDISDNVVIDASDVDVSTPGNYQVTYDVDDNAGNSAVQQIRNVEVVAQVRTLTSFSGITEANGRELFSTDGTTEGTNMVKDVVVGSGDFIIQNLTQVGNRAYFTADDGVNGQALWKSDGTAETTVLVKTFPENPSFFGAGFTNVNGVLFFQAGTDAAGVELWKSDGTSEGTVMVKDINVGESDSYARNLVDVNGVLYFTADLGGDEDELWKSDGTEAGTVKVKAFSPIDIDGSPSLLTSMNGMLYFTLYDQNGSDDLWRSDGTEQGTIKLQDFAIINQLTLMNNKLFFSSNAALWSSDGTSDGTVQVKLIPTSDGTSESFVASNGTLYFSIQGEMWTSDGTTEGTSQYTFDARTPYPLIAINGNILFDHSINGNELWFSDGTEVGTKILKQINPNGSSSVNLQVNSLNLADGRILFAANDGTSGLEPWVSDGTAEGTVLLKDINPGSLQGIGL